MTLYIDVTSTLAAKNTTGIQRVTKAITLAIFKRNTKSKVIHANNGEFYELSSLDSLQSEFGQKKQRPSAHITNSIKDFTLRHTSTHIQKKLVQLHNHTTAALRHLQTRLHLINLGRKIEPRRGDTLLILDLTTRHKLHTAIAQSHNRGCRVFCVVHDIIPLHAPHLFPPLHAHNFKISFNAILDYCTVFLCASKTTANALSEELLSRKKEAQIGIIKFGADFPKQKDTEEVFESYLASQRPYFLMVGTIEPRKNHEIAIEAFQKLWDQGFNANLLIIGNPGWKCQHTLLQIEKTKRQYKKLEYLENISDSQLDAAYKSTQALIFPSLSEGFGLPIIEALQRGTHVILSDIPIHREVASEYGLFFPPHNATELCKHILAVAARPRPPRRPYPSWENCADAVLEIMRAHDIAHRRQ